MGQMQGHLVKQMSTFCLVVVVVVEGGTSCMYLKNTMLLWVTQTKTFSPKCPAL